ncbi:MAG: aldo/keto reductase [Polyangiaceae bacterium]|nr:aldo/keto reductase [Polyangiaceae bacterium]
MNQRTLGRTDFTVSEIAFGAWAIGSAWGAVDDAESLRALHAAVDAGMTFIDTADVYGDGRSERLVGRLRKERRELLRIATKAGRRLQPHTPDGYNLANLRAFVERSLKNLDVEAIDLLQLHCPPPAVYARPEVFGALDALVSEGKLRYYGVSVETVDEAKAALRFPGVQSVQIIFNMFRPKPAQEFFALAAKARVGIIVRVPLASGLLSGKWNASTTFAADDHRNFNARGEAFDVGETFSGVGLEDGLCAVEELRPLTPPGATLAQLALRWILMFPEVSCAIPGAKNPVQAQENAAAAALPALDRAAMAKAQDVYDRHFREHIHGRW